MKLIKEEVSPDEKLSHKVTGEPENLTKEDKLATLKELFKMAKERKPDYAAIKKELDEYNVALPNVLTMDDLSGMNKLYSITQSFLSRVAAIESLVIDNAGRWERLLNLMKGYIEDEECVFIMEKEIQELANVRLQNAAVRNKMTKEYSTLRVIEESEQEAENFRKQVAVKKKDLVLVLTNLSRQVKALSLDHYGIK